MELLRELIIKLIGFIVGVIVGLIVMILAYQLLELITSLTESGYVRYRMPIAFYILPIIIGVIGWLVFPTLNYKVVFRK